MAKVAQDKKGQNVTIIGVEGRSSYTDYLVIATAYSDRQTRAIANAIEDDLRDKRGLTLIGREGRTGWIILDYGDIVVHVFHEDTRAHYDLDRMWATAPRVRVPPPEIWHDREPPMARALDH
ncbi:MAG: ribosome silencing factor [Deltaproteobacteria bacterium]|nr:ribosome silencing factor [Deltaproteobacteria bacterium]